MRLRRSVITGCGVVLFILAGCMGGALPGMAPDASTNDVFKDIDGESVGMDLQVDLVDVSDTVMDMGMPDEGPGLDVQTGEEQTGDQVVGDGTAQDGMDVYVDTEVGDGIATQDPGQDLADVSRCPGAAGCPCEQDKDCDSGACIDTWSGLECANPCKGDDDCKPGYHCEDLSGVQVCVYDMPYLCLPCVEDKDCTSPHAVAGAMCVARVPRVGTPDEGTWAAFCGGACEQDSDCPSGFVCNMVMTVAGQNVKQCVPEKGECGCTDKAVDLQMTGVCFVGNEFGVCQGQYQCDADGKVECSASTAFPGETRDRIRSAALHRLMASPPCGGFNAGVCTIVHGLAPEAIGMSPSARAGSRNRSGNKRMHTDRESAPLLGGR